MPIIGHRSPKNGDDFQDQPKPHPGLETGLKTRIRELFISSDFQNTAYLGLFLNGARYGLLLGCEKGNRRPD